MRATSKPARGSAGRVPASRLGSLSRSILACWISFAAMIFLNVLFEALPLGGVTTADVSNEVFAWFAPAGCVFMIWAVIYLALGLWLALVTRRASSLGIERRRALSRTSAALFVLTCALNIAWLVVWHLKVFPASMVLIVIYWVAVAALYLKEKTAPEFWHWAPFSVYGGWLTVAVVANAAHLLTRYVTADAGIIPAVSTIVLLALLLGVSFLMRRLFDDYLFGAVVLWAAVGIGVRLMAESVIMGVAVIALSALGAVAVYVPWEKLQISRRAEG